MSWIFLLLAGLTEVGWAVGFKYIEGFNKPWILLATIGSMLVSLYFLWLALKVIPLSVAYPIWTGIGMIGTFAAGVILFGDSITPLKIASVCLLIAGIIGLKL